MGGGYVGALYERFGCLFLVFFFKLVFDNFTLFQTRIIRCIFVLVICSACMGLVYTVQKEKLLPFFWQY